MHAPSSIAGEPPLPAPGGGLAAPRSFRGWHIVGMMLVAQTLTVGATTYAYSLFLKPIGQEFGIDPSRLPLGHVGLLFALMLAGPPLGVALDRRSVRALVVAGALLFAAGLTLMALSPSIAALAVSYWVLVSVGSLLAGPVPASKLVASWFVRMRGRALGISSLGTSTGGMLIPPICAWGIEILGWRGALLLLAGLTVVGVVPAAALLIASRPEDRGQLPDGDGVRVAGAEPPRLPIKALLRERTYWGIALAFGLPWAVIASLFTFFGLYLNELGSGAGIISLISGCAIAGKLVFGRLAERVDPRWLVWLGLVVQLGYLVVLRLHPGPELLIAASAAFGVSLGGLLPMHGALIAHHFGSGSFASVMGALGPVMTPLMFGSVALGGWLPGVTGSYARLFECFILAQGVAIAALGLVRPARRA